MWIIKITSSDTGASGWLSNKNLFTLRRHVAQKYENKADAESVAKDLPEQLKAEVEEY